MDASVSYTRGWKDAAALGLIVTAAHFTLGVMAGLMAQRHAGRPTDLLGATLPGALVASNVVFTAIVVATFWRTRWRAALPRVYLILGALSGPAMFLSPALWAGWTLVVYIGALWWARVAFADDDAPRRHRGASAGVANACADCGYDLIGLDRERSPVCPECGLRLPRRSRGVPLN